MPDFAFEEQFLSTKGGFIAGMDEVGRGPIAGPMAAAIVILNPADLPIGLNDSKALSAKARERAFDEICAKALALSFATATAEEIDRIDIRQATHLAMRRCALRLALQPRHILIDGNDLPPNLPCAATTLVKGDARSLSIAAASIIAKVLRDRLMARVAKRYPQYAFEQHAGYPTQRHLAALRLHGPCPIHRMSFRSLRSH